MLERAAIRHAAEWLDGRLQLGRDVFGRGEIAGATARSSRTTDITDLFRACLVALRVPEQADAYQLRFIKLWRVPDAMARITRMLGEQPRGGALASFLPALQGEAENQELRCRAAVASTFLGALELARQGALDLQQEEVWQEVLIVGA